MSRLLVALFIVGAIWVISITYLAVDATSRVRRLEGARQYQIDYISADEIELIPSGD